MKTKRPLRLFRIAGCAAFGILLRVALCAVPFAAFAETHEEYLRLYLNFNMDDTFFYSFDPVYSAMALAAVTPPAWIGNFTGSVNDENAYHFYAGLQAVGTLVDPVRFVNLGTADDFGLSALPFIRVGGFALPFDFALGGIYLPFAVRDTRYAATELFLDFRYRIVMEETGFNLVETSDNLLHVSDADAANSIPSVSINAGLGYMTMEQRDTASNIQMSTTDAGIYPNVYGDADITVIKEYWSVFLGLQASKRIVIWNTWLEESAMWTLGVPFFAIEPYAGIQVVWGFGKTDGEIFAHNMISEPSGVKTPVPSIRITETFDYSYSIQAQGYAGLSLVFAGAVQINLGVSWNFVSSIPGAMVSLGYRH